MKSQIACSICPKTATHQCSECAQLYCSKKCQLHDWINMNHALICAKRKRKFKVRAEDDPQSDPEDEEYDRKLDPDLDLFPEQSLSSEDEDDPRKRRARSEPPENKREHMNMAARKFFSTVRVNPVLMESLVNSMSLEDIEQLRHQGVLNPLRDHLWNNSLFWFHVSKKWGLIPEDAVFNINTKYKQAAIDNLIIPNTTLYLKNVPGRTKGMPALELEVLNNLARNEAALDVLVKDTTAYDLVNWSSVSVDFHQKLIQNNYFWFKLLQSLTNRQAGVNLMLALYIDQYDPEVDYRDMMSSNDLKTFFPSILVVKLTISGDIEGDINRQAWKRAAPYENHDYENKYVTMFDIINAGGIRQYLDNLEGSVSNLVWTTEDGDEGDESRIVEWFHTKVGYDHYDESDTYPNTEGWYNNLALAAEYSGFDINQRLISGDPITIDIEYTLSDDEGGVTLFIELQRDYERIPSGDLTIYEAHTFWQGTRRSHIMDTVIDYFGQEDIYQDIPEDSYIDVTVKSDDTSADEHDNMEFLAEEFGPDMLVDFIVNSYVWSHHDGGSVEVTVNLKTK